MQIAERGISKNVYFAEFYLRKFFAELKLWKMFLLLSYVKWISVQFYRALNHHAHKPRCVLQEEILGWFLSLFWYAYVTLINVQNISLYTC